MVGMYTIYAKKTVRGLFLALISLCMFPTYALAAPSDLQGYISAISGFINNTLLPLIFAIALLFFLINVARYFILKGSDASAREQARQYALYSIIAFVVIVAIWGIVGIITAAFNIDDTPPICPDYNPDCNDVAPVQDTRHNLLWI